MTDILIGVLDVRDPHGLSIPRQSLAGKATCHRTQEEHLCQMGGIVKIRSRPCAGIKDAIYPLIIVTDLFVLMLFEGLMNVHWIEHRG